MLSISTVGATKVEVLPSGSGRENSHWNRKPATILLKTCHLENLVHHNFRQLWLVSGVKLMEINSNLFSRHFWPGWKQTPFIRNQTATDETLKDPTSERVKIWSDFFATENTTSAQKVAFWKGSPRLFQGKSRLVKYYIIWFMINFDFETHREVQNCEG